MFNNWKYDVGGLDESRLIMKEWLNRTAFDEEMLYKEAIRQIWKGYLAKERLADLSYGHTSASTFSSCPLLHLHL